MSGRNDRLIENDEIRIQYRWPPDAKPDSSKGEAVVRKMHYGFFFCFLFFVFVDVEQIQRSHVFATAADLERSLERPCCQTWLKVAAKLFTRVKDEEGWGGRGVRWAVIVTRGRLH